MAVYHKTGESFSYAWAPCLVPFHSVFYNFVFEDIIPVRAHLNIHPELVYHLMLWIKILKNHILLSLKVWLLFFTGILQRCCLLQLMSTVEELMTFFICQLTSRQVNSGNLFWWKENFFVSLINIYVSFTEQMQCGICIHQHDWSSSDCSLPSGSTQWLGCDNNLLFCSV